MTTVGCIGLGIMGAPQARNLARAGFDVIGFNRSPKKVADLADAGVRAAPSIAALAEASDVVITSLPDSPDVEEVVLGEDGVFSRIAPGSLYIDMSTIRPDVAMRLSVAGAAAGIAVLDAPVSGGEEGAIAGTLSIMVGGSADAFARARPVLEAMGERIVLVGGPGAGQTVKGANQIMVAANAQGLAEAIAFLEAHGVDATTALGVLGGGMAGSAVLERKAKNMVDRSFAPGFTLDLFHKDLGIVAAAAREKGVSTLLGALCAQVVGTLVAQGDGQLDHSAVIKVVAQLSGELGATTAEPRGRL